MATATQTFDAIIIGAGQAGPPLAGRLTAAGQTVAVLTILALGELVTDQLPKTPSRRVPQQFGARLFTGAFAGAVLATGAVLNPTAWVVVGAIGAALIGAVLGTLGGAEARRRLVAGNGGHDLPVALVEDAIAIVGGFAIVALALVI